MKLTSLMTSHSTTGDSRSSYSHILLHQFEQVNPLTATHKELPNVHRSDSIGNPYPCPYHLTPHTSHLIPHTAQPLLQAPPLLKPSPSAEQTQYIATGAPQAWPYRPAPGPPKHLCIHSFLMEGCTIFLLSSFSSRPVYPTPQNDSKIP